MQKVLFVIPMLRRAGAECQLVALINALPPDRFEKHLLAYREGDGLVADVNTSEVRIHTCLRQSKIDISLGKSIGTIIDEHRIDVVHCTLQNSVLYGLMGIHFAKRAAKLVAVIHTTENVDIWHDIADKFFYQPILKRCDSVWFVSATQADHWMKKMPFLTSKCQVIHNGIDLEYFDPDRFQSHGRELRGDLGVADEEVVYCSVAGFRAEKLHHVLIEAFALLSAKEIPVRLMLAGAGPTEAGVRALVAARGLQDRVTFLGSIADVRPVLAASDAKVLVSAAETFSMAMLEAMAMGLPVITTSIGGAAEAIDDARNGYLVDPDDAVNLSAVMERLAADASLRKIVGRRARETVTENFGLRNMVKKSDHNLSVLSETSGAS